MSTVPQLCGKFRILAYFPHFCQNVPHFWLISKQQKSLKNAKKICCTERHFVRKSSAKSTMIAPTSFLIVIFIQKSLKNAKKICCTERHFVRKSSAKSTMIAPTSFLIVIFIQKSLKIPNLNCRRHFAKTSMKASPSY